MDEHNRNNIRLGIFVTAALILFTVAIYYMGNRQYLFGSTIRISTVFTSVKGLKIGNNVRYAGLNIGIVNDLVFVNDSMIRADMNLDRAYIQYIKTDALATISTNGLVGDMIINITPGRGAGRTLKDGDIIESYSGISTDDVLGILNTAGDDMGTLILNLNRIAETMLKGDGMAASLLHDPKMADDIENMVSNLSRASDNINIFSSELKVSMDQLHRGEGLLGYLLNDTTLVNKVELVMSNLDSMVTKKIDPLVANMEASSAHILTTSVEMEDLVTQIDLSEGPIGLLLSDTMTTQNIQEILNNLNEGTSRFNESMEALKHNFLLRGYFKKQEKKRLQELKKAN